MSADISESASYLLRCQNTDGGWSYRPSGSSWTEPTCLALLALRRLAGPQVGRGFAWLSLQRRSDGGWGPRPGIAESTWVTSLGLLALHSAGRLNRDDAAIRWLTEVAGAESGWMVRLRTYLLGGSDGIDSSKRGWPWFPRSSAWVAPTAMALVALERVHRSFLSVDLLKRASEGKAFLLSRRCADGGWNHGSSRALGYDGPSYPETTGMALLALAGEAQAAQSINKALEHLSRCRSVESWSWLRMGLWAQKANASAQRPQLRIHDTRDASLYLLAEASLAGRDPFGRD